MLLLMLCSWLTPRQASAASYVDEAYNYQVMLNGANTIRIKVPVYNEKSDDHWVCDGNLKVSVADDKGNFGDEQVVFWWREDESKAGHDNDHSDLWCKFKTQAGGSFDVTQGNSSNHFTLTKADGELRRLVYENSDGRTYDVTVVWRLPYDLLGKTLKFSWDVKCDYTNGLVWDTSYSVTGLSNTTISVPKAQSTVAPQVTLATMSYSESGKLEIPWFIASNGLTAVHYEYTDGDGSTIKKELPVKENNSTIYLDATEPHNNFRVVVSYLDNNNYPIENVSSEIQNLKMIHAPVGLTARPSGDHNASVHLSWSIQHPETEDLTSTDFFEIQRSLTGKESDFVTIGSVPFVLDPENLNFNYVDSTLVNAIADGMLKGNGTLDSLTYRVRRMMTQNWGWEGNNCAASAHCVVDDLHLLRISNYTAQWEDERAFTVRVAWEYADEFNAVWDNRAKMMMRVTMTNSKDELVESNEYELTSKELEQKYKILDLSRSCIKYNIELYVDRGTSPIHKLDELTTFYYPIRTVDDWDNFCSQVDYAKGEKAVNARLYSDLRVSKEVSASVLSPFTGHFDGNGHTLTFIKDEKSEYNAPFRYVGNATFTNLHIDGSFTSNQKFTSGLIGRVKENSIVFIEGCRSSAIISSSINGDATNGGFIALTGNEVQITFRDCLFDGSFEGKTCSNNGGYIGAVYPDSKITIESSLFSPGHIDTQFDGCRTWARMSATATLSVRNSYYTMEYASISYDKNKNFIIRNSEDWKTFKQLVESASGNNDVNAILYADITPNEMVGTSSNPYRGKFDGNGHVLDVTINGTTSMTAPFAYVTGTTTIKNLHVKGSVRGGIHTSGLIGGAVNSPTINIENVWVSPSITTTSTHVGGFIGHASDVGSTVVMKNCRFDGTLNSTQTSGERYAGAFVGWGSGTWDQRYLYENGSSSNINHFGMNYRNASAWSGSENCVSAHNWGEVSAGSRNVTNQNTVLTSMNASQPGAWEKLQGLAAPVQSFTQTSIDLDSTSDWQKAFGENWKVEGNSIVPALTSFKYPSSNATQPQLPDFYHEGSGTIGNKLVVQPRQSSVVLTWTVNGVVDYFQVMRRPTGSGDDKWEVIADQLDHTGYEDTSVSPLEKYEYKVLAISDCEGLHTSSTEVKEGFCKNTGRVSGYVRMKDGTGVAGIEVEISYNNKKETSVKTDESGYFTADNLPYKGLDVITYTVAPVSSDAIKLEVGSHDVKFDSNSNDEKIPDFTITNSHLFSGFVMYEGTGIPVKGVRFRVDGHDLHDATGKYVETGFDGSFSFRVLDGNRVIQAFRDGHTFTDEGFFKSKDGYVFNDDVAQIYFYDATRVKVTGRIVGGKDQGNLPLDNNLSRNNLGDDLTMVVTLEGDNTSWLVYDNLNPENAVRDTTFVHPAGGGHKTTVRIERKRMEVKPDTVTGEYVLMLPPVRWKVQQIYCEGYATLFQDGQVSEVIDLTDCLTQQTIENEGSFMDVDGHTVYKPVECYNYRYNRIYHSPVEITYKQLGYDTFDYFGDKSYTATTMGGGSFEVPLVYPKTENPSGVAPTGSQNTSETVVAAYTFGAPVFSIDRQYPIQIQVAEHYIYNNNPRSGRIDMVKVGGGKVTIHNGMKNGLDRQTLELDSLGQAIYILEADQTTRFLTDKDALQTVSLTLEQDGTTYEATPLKGYTLNMFALGGSKDVVVNGQPQLIDILRDPPGGGSSATLSKGSKLKYTYTLDMALHAGLKLSITTGSTLDNFQGNVAAPSGSGGVAGIINSSNNEELFNFEYAFDMEGKRAFSYTMNINEDISTSNDMSMVGSDADVYIGMVQNIVVTPMSTIRAVPDSLYQQMLGKLGGGQSAGIKNPYGTLVEIAQGQDGEGKLYHLIRDESIGYGPEVTSQFIHSQKHILTQLLPEKVKELRDLMFTGTPEEAQKLANATGKPVYRSLVDVNDDNFAVVNTKDDDIYYYTSTMPEEQGMNYVIHLPTGTTTRPVDEVSEKCQIIYAWIHMIAENEHEKIVTINSNNPMANYNVDGGTKVNYSEQFESDYTISNYYHLPGIISAPYFDTSGADLGITIGSLVGVKVVSAILKVIYDKYVNSKTTSTGTTGAGAGQNGFNTRVSFYGSTFKFSLLPTLDYKVKDVSGESKTYNRKESFNISMDKKSHLNFDVYRVETATDILKSAGQLDVYTNQNFTDMTNYVEGYLKRDNNMENARYSRGFIYHTRGGATVNPWEDQRTTLFYSKGSVLDERTKKIQNPKISLDRQSVSGVAIGDPACFTVYLTNDSEQPESSGGGISIYNFYLDETSNPNGAKVMVDGIALTSSGWDITLTPGVVTQKTIEVYAGREFDYEGLRIGVKSKTDWTHVDERVAFDVHYLRQAGAVAISSPGDKWIMNTDAQFNKKRGWFLPVTISGFNKHQKNFDHIEFQYKESQRGDDYWTNLCSYYADSTLLAQANGVCEMIPENGNITTQFYGEGTVMEKAYDLRAVLYCRDGNSFLTTASQIISGVKDTRRPQLFGSPEPVSGILKAGNNIIFNFSESIEHNYLSAITNFEVKGEVNNNNVSESVSLQFTGQASVESEAQRNFSGKDLTIGLMVKPDKTGKEMPLFSHGTNGKKLQLWLTQDFRLKAVVNGQEFTSDKSINDKGFTQVALVMSQDSTLTFYNGGVEIGRNKLKELYSGTGPLIFGRTNESNRNKSKYYQGRMMEARLWYRALSGSLLGTTYGNRRLTGYEMGLVDYYPMNEGTGSYAIDHTQGANATLIGASWAMPRGLSLHVKRADQGLPLSNQALSRTTEQDYTLMLWFKTDAQGQGVLLANGSGKATDTGAEDQFCLGFEGGKLIYRSNGMAVEIPGNWCDNQWHHYAMTVNRSLGIANIYIDTTLRSTFPADSLGGITGGHPFIGAAVYDEKQSDGKTATLDTRNWLEGYIDEFCLFEQALPLALIKSFSTKSPNGDEAGLLTYLSFDRQERQGDNDIVLVPYPYSRKIYLDDNGNVKYQVDPVTKEKTSTPVRDYSFDSSVSIETLLSHIVDTDAAPVVPYEELKNLKFSFVGKDNQVLVSIDEPASRINRNNVYVTVRNVEDKNGNAMASPVTACYYVTNSNLQWVINRMNETVLYGEGQTINFIISNDGASSHTYTIENCPKWLTLSSYSNIIGSQDMVSITGTVNKSLNVGTYDEIIYLTDEDGISEPLYLNLTIEKPEPDWAWHVPGELLQHTMNIAGQVYLNNEIDIDSRDIVGVFDNENQCHGFAHINYNEQTSDASIYLTIYDNETRGRELSFKLWQYSTGHELTLKLSIDGKDPVSTIIFERSAVLGTEKPVLFYGGNSFVQTFNLKKGWNWVSFNVYSEKFTNLNNLLKGVPWEEGDVLTDISSRQTLVFTKGEWLSTDSLKSIRLSPRKAYAVKVQNDIEFPIAGTVIKDEDQRTMILKSGWNGIGYTPMLNLSVETALSDYYDKAQPGDVIKSHDEFAYFTIIGGVGRWKGSLQYMKPDEGYMLLRKAQTETTFTYPYYEPGSTLIDEWSYPSTRRSQRSLHTMSLSAIVQGFEPEAGDSLIAYSDGEICGAVKATNGDVLYMSINGEQQQPLWFAIERNGEIVASTPEMMSFSANAVVGSPDEPTAINFVRNSYEDGMWYTTSGIQLQQRPTEKGVYIYNGKKILIK